MTSPALLYTAQRIIRLAYQDAGIVQEGDEPNSQQYADALYRLMDLLNLWTTQGVKLWLQLDVSVPLTAGVGAYTLGPGGTVNMQKPLRVLQAYYADAQGNTRFLNPLAREDFTRLTNPAQPGELVNYFVDKQQLYLGVNVWPVPTSVVATGTLHLITQVSATLPLTLTSDLGFPAEWYMALRWGLADELSTGQPQSIMQRCQARAEAFRTALEDWDVEDAPVTFGASSMGLSTGNFR